MKVVVTGATGVIGKPLCGLLLEAGHQVVVFSRDAAKAQATLGAKVESVAWGGQAGSEWRAAFGSADTVVHLAGESVGGQRWNDAFKEKIRRSRVDTTRTLVEAMAQSERKPAAFVCASAVGFYGDRRDETLNEDSPPGSDFLGQVCKEWEAEAQKAEALGVRVARMRIGIVLGKEGALEKMLHPLPLPLSPWKLGLGGPLGSGKQWMPWVHLDDTAGLFFWATTNDAVSGPINVAAPDPVTNAEFSHALGRALHRPSFAAVPAFALKAMLGEFAEILLGGQRLLPSRALALGYTFRYPELDAALQSLV
ncbi:MAG TPA: TIGR01777 family oxidoreductase [Chthonomonadaceae bacterium]|nr:TIGR01777 family oxidoreductase [Chthonomonadaceae bacterium]